MVLGRSEPFPAAEFQPVVGREVDDNMARSVRVFCFINTGDELAVGIQKIVCLLRIFPFALGKVKAPVIFDGIGDNCSVSADINGRDIHKAGSPVTVITDGDGEYTVRIPAVFLRGCGRGFRLLCLQFSRVGFIEGTDVRQGVVHNCGRRFGCTAAAGKRGQ